MRLPSLPRAAAVLTATAFACVFLFAAAELHAGDDDKPKKRDTSKVAKRGAKHLRYQKTYAAALLEARIRNLPVFVSRHKDFWGRCTRQYRSVLTNKSFVRWAHENLVVLVPHNELGHDPIEVKGYDGKVEKQCPLYPGITCRDHVDAAVDIETTRDEDLVTVPFIELCPNSWLVPPTGQPIRIAEADQFIPARIQKQVAPLRKQWGAIVSEEAFRQVVNAFDQAESANDDDAWGKALQALAGIAKLVPEPHAALKAMIAGRMKQIDEPVGWAVEEIDEDEKTELAERLKAMQALRKRVAVAVYGDHLPAVKAIDAWLAKHAPKDG